MKTPTHSDRFAKGLAIVVVLSLNAVMSPAIVNAAGLRTVALTGQPAPGTSGGVTYETFGNFFGTYGIDTPKSRFRGPVLNDAGQTAFRANLTGSGVGSTNNQGVWSEGSNSLALVARTGSQAPGAPAGVNFSSTFSGAELFSPVLNNAGQTAFFGGLTSGGLGVWSEGSGSLATVARDGLHAPGTPSGTNFAFARFIPDFTFLFAELPLLNDAGQTAFPAPLAGGGANSTNDAGVWSEGSGSLALVARRGSPAAGMPSGVNYEWPHIAVDLNDVGQTAITSRLAGSGVDDTNNAAVWSGPSDSLAVVARGGTQAPGTPGGVNFGDVFDPITLNNAGQTAFVATLTGSGVDSTNDDGLWSNVGGSLHLVARAGTQAPGTPSGVNFDEVIFRAWHVLNDAGQIAFHATLAGTEVDSTNNQGIWLEDSGSFALVARMGNQASGTPSGVNFSELNHPALNSAGQIAFRANVVGDGVDFSNDRGIWATDKNGNLQLLARTGDVLEVAPGDLRTLSSLDFVASSGNSDGRPTGFNNVGQLVFWASFTDGSQGVFVSNKVATVPGDFNFDGTVDAADYVVWRKGLGTFYTQSHYDIWRAHFGASLGPGSGAALPSADPLSAAVPEPATLILMVLAAVGWSLRRRRAA